MDYMDPMSSVPKKADKLNLSLSRGNYGFFEELHIVTARKPRIHQNQPVVQYLHKIQPCML